MVNFMTGWLSLPLWKYSISCRLLCKATALWKSCQRWQKNNRPEETTNPWWEEFEQQHCARKVVEKRVKFSTYFTSTVWYSPPRPSTVHSKLGSMSGVNNRCHGSISQSAQVDVHYAHFVLMNSSCGEGWNLIVVVVTPLLASCRLKSTRISFYTNF